ncbi:anthranilate synthase component II [Gimibacter soli]|uniref:Aminodeoxychorismate/anthranilate synthase component II n=1 Tax=Gimibacter soli TaxID=3024400 RepID=A0AAE9XS30_9PROT|nr:aminodeoxychorismate/anthranilate synthase component II [Gimibacter soli]WCL52955.1 aminodeoxychorismate/anthranilate synthase component II [Gimibacter soli]
MYILIDNYDSFTYNLYHYFVEKGAEVTVYRNDQISVADVMAQKPEGIILSPGPCTPNEAGICLDTIKAVTEAPLPLFGVCLGHQAIGQAFGGTVCRAPKVMHGKVSEITHNGTGLFAGLPSPYAATRYHSLIVARDDLPECLEVTSETEDGLIMGLAHKTLPIHGVQFHPESIASEHGHALIANFMKIAAEFGK